MKLITQSCTPRADVLQGELTDQHFAAQLDAVVRNPDKYPVYGDPDELDEASDTGEGEVASPS